MRGREEPEVPVGFRGPSIPMPPPQIFLVIGAMLLLTILAYLIATRKKDEDAARAPMGGKSGPIDDPRDRPPSAHLSDAAALADAGRFREALRALYLATLVALDRRRMISFDPTLTNWQYLKQMPQGEARQLFAQFTRLFDFKWYGEEGTSRADYEEARGIADRICAPAEADVVRDSLPPETRSPGSDRSAA
jgi:hypothetical protein